LSVFLVFTSHISSKRNKQHTVESSAANRLSVIKQTD
jgi:hypothetical protein